MDNMYINCTYVCEIHAMQESQKTNQMNLEKMIFLELRKKAYFCYHPYNIGHFWTIR